MISLTRTVPSRRAARTAEVRAHCRRLVPAPVAETEAARQAVLVLPADRNVPRWLIRPAPGTRTSVLIFVPTTSGARRLKLLDGVGPGVGPGGVGVELKVAVTLRAPRTETVQVEVPEQPDPLQPANSDPEAAAAVRVTWLDSGKLAEQAEPQSMPAGDEVTVPWPLPSRETVSV